MYPRNFQECRILLRHLIMLDFTPNSGSDKLMKKWLQHMNLLKMPLSEKNFERRKASWLIQLRWIVITFCFLLTFPLLYLNYLDTKSLPQYMGLIGIALLFNLLSNVFFLEEDKFTDRLVLCFQLAFDLAWITFTLFTIKGMDNPFSTIFYLYVCMGMFLLSSSLILPYLLLCHGCLAFLQIQFFRTSPIIQFHQILCGHILLWLFGWTMHSLGKYVEKSYFYQTAMLAATTKQDSLRALGLLAAGFSHEFASPLNAVKIRLIRASRQSPDDENILQALASLKNCENVIHRMNQSQMDVTQPSIQNLSAAIFVQDVVASWEKVHQPVCLNIDVNKAGMICVAPIAFAQVIDNLLTNAVEANKTGTIRLMFESSENNHIFSIDDSGNGFPTHVISNLGKPFVSTKPKGVGLGLYISRLFAESLGGELSVSSLAPHGSRVTIQWPNMKVTNG